MSVCTSNVHVDGSTGSRSRGEPAPSMERMPEEPRVEETEGAQQRPHEDWLEDELPPDDQQGTDWRQIGLIAAFLALIVGIAVFFVWTYLIPTGGQTGL